MPRCATTMPQVNSGVRHGLRPSSGSTLATANPAASDRPNSGSTPGGASTTSPAPVKPAAATGHIIRSSSAFALSRRQRSSGPAAMTTTSASATGPAALLKKGGPTDSCTPKPAATSG